jgi:hypothetical protein
MSGKGGMLLREAKIVSSELQSSKEQSVTHLRIHRTQRLSRQFRVASMASVVCRWLPRRWHRTRSRHISSTAIPRIYMSSSGRALNNLPRRAGCSLTSAASASAAQDGSPRPTTLEPDRSRFVFRKCAYGRWLNCSVTASAALSLPNCAPPPASWSSGQDGRKRSLKKRQLSLKRWKPRMQPSECKTGLP